MLQMNYLASSAILRNNDQVVTAGSTVYPRDLILGHVVDADFDETGVAKYAILEPATDFSNLEQVFIITEYNIG
jgi:rod shape-determining protein MreC